MADPFSLTTGIISLLTLAIKLVAGAAGLIDKTTTAHREAANELQALQWDLERLDRQMDQIHGTLQFLATNTKDRAFKKLLQDEYGKIAIQILCSALDGTFVILERLTDRAGSEKTNLQAIALPANEKSLAYVQAILKHSFSPSKVADLVTNLKSMQSEIRTCLEKLESSFKHVQDLYNITDNRLERIATSTSIVSTSTMLTARIKLAGWLKRREGIWGLSSRSTPTKLGDFLDTDHLLRMPSGVLGKILCHLCSDGPLALRHLLFASKGLYYAAVNDASLWTTISFDTAFFKHFRRRPVEQAKGFTEQCLRWSSSLPLCIRIASDGSGTFGGDLLPGSLRALSNPKYRGPERCASLIWYHRPKDAVPAKTIMALLPKELPSLRHLSLTHFQDPTDGTQFPNCPVLEKVEVLSHFEPFPALWGTNLARVTTLSFGNYDNWAYYDTGTLALFPALQDLTLFTTNPCQARMLDFPEPAPPFQYLKTLRVRGNLPPELFIRLVAPALEALHIEANDFGWTSTDTLRDSFSPLCLHLYALLPELVTRTEPQWAANLLMFVQKCTRVETFFVSKWMEVKFITRLDDSKVVLHVL